MKRILLLSVSFLLSCNFLNAQTNLSLSQAIETALGNANNLKIAKLNTSSAEMQNNWGEAGRYPTISANLNNSNTYNNIQNPTSFLNGAQLLGTGATATVDLQWTLYDGGRVRSTKDRLAVLAEQTGMNEQVVVDNVAQQVAKAYFNALVQQKRLEVLADVLGLSKDKIKYIEAKQEFGQAGEFDLLQIQDAYLNDSIQWLLQKVNYENALQNLSLAMGMEVGTDTDLNLTDSLNYLLPAYEFDALKEDLINNNAQMKVEQANIRISELDIKLQEANQYPRISMGANVSEQLTLNQINGRQPQIPNDWQGGTTFSAGVNFTVSYTIYNGGRIKRGIELAQLRRQIANTNLNELERSLTQQLKIALNRYASQQEVLSLSQALLSNAKRNLNIAEERFKANTLNYFDFRTIQINYIRALTTVQDAFLNAKTTEFDLLLLTGKLMEE
jgi:outer membrane protein